MNYVEHEYNEVVELIIEGNVLQENVEVLKSRFQELVDSGKVRVVLNMKQANYVSSLCLAVIVDMKKRLVSLEGDLRIANVNRLVKNLLEITNLVKKIKMYDNVDEAIRSFTK